MTTVTRPQTTTPAVEPQPGRQRTEQERYAGQPMPRLDGLAKATGTALYTFDRQLPDMVYGVVVGAAQAHARVVAVDHASALEMPGVLLVFSVENCPPTPARDDQHEPYVWFSREIVFDGQAVAFIVATTHTAAEDAARALRVSYDPLPHAATLAAAMAPDAPQVGASPNIVDPDDGKLGDGLWDANYRRGDVQQGLQKADVALTARYTIAPEAHVPWETFATLATWDGSLLTIYESTQDPNGARDTIAAALALEPDQVRVLAEYVGGGFGAKFDPLPQAALAARATHQLQRPVKTWLACALGMRLGKHRPATIHDLQVGAAASGELTALDHLCYSAGSPGDSYYDMGAMTARFLYACPHVLSQHRRVNVTFTPPTSMRAPGGFQSQFALETALDELAHALALDPIDLRRRNHAAINPMTGKSYSSQQMLACVERAAALIGWDRRTPAPSAKHPSGVHRGLGMAVAFWPTFRTRSQTGVRIDAGGAIIVSTSAVDIGTGTYTILAQVAADAVGADLRDVRVQLGDTRHPAGAAAGGSMGASAASNATHVAGQAAREALITAALAIPDGPFAGCSAADLTTAWSQVLHHDDPQRALSFAAVTRAAGEISVTGSWKPEKVDVELADVGAHCAEVEVDIETGMVRVLHFVAVHESGRVLNAQTFRSQLAGGIIWGISAALMEAMQIDRRQGRLLNAGLAEYHIPTALDIDQLTIEWFDEPDLHANPLGVKGVGEVGITGAAPAIGNAIFNAAGIRLRDLPFTPRRVLEG